MRGGDEEEVDWTKASANENDKCTMRFKEP